MEDILDLYAEPFDPQSPVINFDETPYQLIGETRIPVPVAPTMPMRYDYEYKRNGTCNLFVFFQPLLGWRHLKITEHRTSIDFALAMRDLVDIHFPNASLIRVIFDNLSTHTPAALYQAFAPEEARRILKKLEFHYTPTHASWLNMVEIEISVLKEQCLDRRIPSTDTLRTEIEAWQNQRNQAKATVNWRFTSEGARKKLNRLYPKPLATT